jgi:hypothetical protein
MKHDPRALEHPAACRSCAGIGNELVIMDDGGFYWSRCLTCNGLRYEGDRRDLSTPLLAWALRDGFSWPQARSDATRGSVWRDGAIRSSDSASGELVIRRGDCAVA